MRLLFTLVAAAAASPQLLFEGGQPPSWGINNYRIPALIRTDRGTLIAIAEARTSDADCTRKWLAFRRSTDNGTTWSPIANLFGQDSLPKAHGAGNPVVLFDPLTQSILVHGSVNAPGYCNPTLWNFQVSDGGTDGASWGPPTNITQSLGKWAGATPGPGTGAVIPAGAPHAGRLLVPAHFGAYKFDIVWFSDDHGASWTLSATPLPGLDEVAVAALPNGTLLLNARTYHLNATCDCRAITTSNDGGATWALPLRFDAALIEPVCQGSLVALGGALFFSNPASRDARIDLTVRRSDDGGATWPRSLLLVPGQLDGGYSCMAPGAPLVGSDGIAKGGILYEGLGGIFFSDFPIDLPPAPPPPPPPPPPTFIPAAHPTVQWAGRALKASDGGGAMSFDWPGTTGAFTASSATYFTAVFTGACGPPGKGARLESAVDGGALDAQSRGAFWVLPASPLTPYRIPLARDLPLGTHALTIRVGVEARWAGCANGTTVTLAGVETDGEPVDPVPTTNRRLEWVGDSISAGFGTVSPCTKGAAEEEDASRTGALAVACPGLNASCSIVAVSGDTVLVPAGGAAAAKPPLPLIYNRSLTYNAGAAAAWNFSAHAPPHAILLNLGTNDVADANFAADYAPALTRFIVALAGLGGWYEGAPGPPPRVLAWCGPMENSYCSLMGEAVGAAAALGANAAFLGFVNATLDGCDGHPGARGQAELGAALLPLIKGSMGW